MAVLKNRAKMSTSTTGTGTITLGSAEDGYQTFADAGVANADVVRYVIEDGNNWEIGTGTYTSSGTTLSRTVSESSNSDAAINLSGSATVFIGATAEDVKNFVASTGTATAPNDSVSIAIGGQAVASGTNSISLQRANSSGVDSIAAITGNTTTSYGAQGGNSISIGALSKATALAGTAVGYGATSTHVAASAFGTLATTTATNQIALGGSGITARISGAYNLPTSDGTNGQVLTTNGSGAVTFADAAGGGGADLYIANPVSATDPTAAGDNAVGIGDGADATGNDSIAIGTGTIAGLDSVAIGLNAASGTTTGSYNTSIGRSAALYLTTGSNNTAVGRSALQGSNLDKVTGSGNAAIGYGAGSKNAGGNNNTYLGTDAGNAITSGSSNTFIGYNADGAASTSQQTALGYQAVTAGTEAIAIGNSRAGGIGTFAAQIGTNSSSYGAIGNSGTAIGGLTKTTGLDFVFGRSSIASGGSGSLSLGMDNTSSGAGAVTLGKDNTASHTDAVVIGQGASSSAADQITLGHTDQTVRISSAYTLPTADGTNGQVLTTDGSGAVTFADAGGGGGADLYAANESSPSAQPSATGTNAIAIGDSAVASGQDSVAFSKSLASGQQSFAAALTSNSASYGAQGRYSVALGERSKATGRASIAMGFGTATASNSFAAFTSNNGYASAINSFAFGTNAQASGYPSVAMGYEPEAKAEAAVSMGYRTKITSYGYGSAAFGIDAYVAVGSKMVLGGRQFSSNGDCQTGTTVLKGATTDATALQLASGYAGSSPDISNQIVLPNNSAYSFSGTIIARESATNGSDYASWEVKGALLRDANAASTVLGNGIVNKLYATSGASAWAVALSADTTNGGLKVEVTGAAATNIRWVATVNTSEVTYA